MSYQLEFKASAVKELAALPKDAQLSIKKTVQQLTEDPYPRGCKKLEGRSGHYRVRVGNYRIIYQVKNEILTIYIIKIGKRADVYR